MMYFLTGVSCSALTLALAYSWVRVLSSAGFITGCPLAVAAVFTGFVAFQGWLGYFEG